MGCETSFLPIINSGNYTGPDFSGGICLNGAQINGQSLAAAPVNPYDAGAMNHDIEYQYIETAFGKSGNPDFKPTPDYYKALFEADKTLLKTVIANAPLPGDVLTAAYRQSLVDAFYMKAVFEYGLGNEMDAFFKYELKPLDPAGSIMQPSADSLPQAVITALGAIHQGNRLALADYEKLATGGINGQAAGVRLSEQEQTFFNSHLQSLDYLDNRPWDEVPIWEGQYDYKNRIIVPAYDAVSEKWSASGYIDGKAVVMELDERTRAFTRQVTQGGVQYTEVYTPNTESAMGDFNRRGYDYVKLDGVGNVVEQKTIAQPPAATIYESAGLQFRRQAVETGIYPSSPLPSDWNFDTLPLSSTDPYANANLYVLTTQDWEAVANIYTQIAGDLGEISNVRIDYDGVAPVVVGFVSGKEVRVALHDENLVGGDGTGSRSMVLSYRDSDGNLVGTAVGYDAALVGDVGQLPLLGRTASGSVGLFPNENNGSLTLTSAITTYGPNIIDALSLIKAIQSGEPLPILASGLRLANDISNLADLPNYTLSGAASVGSSILSLMSLEQALQRGDTLAALTSGAQALSFGTQAYLNFARSAGEIGTPIADSMNSFLSGTYHAPVYEGGQLVSNGFYEPGAIAYLNLVNDISHGDAIGVAIDVMYFIPALQPIAVALSIFRMISSLFGGDDTPAIPAAWGSGHYTWDGTGVTYTAAGQTGGQEAVSGTLSQLLHSLNTLVAQAQQQNPGSTLGLIPNRMPTLGYSTAGFQFTDIDPLSGAQQHPELRYDNYGRPYNAEPGSPESYQSLIEGMVYSALSRQAIAPLWEVQTAKMQTDAGDPKAGLTEEARAGQDGQLAAPLSGTTQTFRPVVLDLDGDGIETVNKSASGVAFDVDDSGYLKETGWVTGGDAFLTLDRNYNGSTDSGREMFSNSVVDISRRGLAGMAWLDSNYDGKLTALDPVWNELKVWQDDGDGVGEAGEKHTLAALGITELNYAMSTFAQNGQIKQLASPDLEADRDGARVNVVPEGILVQRSADGRLSLLVTRIDDKTAVEANRDGITSYEDAEIIVSSADLLANDTLGGYLGRDLSVVGLTNFRHGSGYLDANGFVHFTPEANYAGSEAGFDYIAQAQNGQQGTVGVDITLQNVNDAPTVADVTHGSRPIYGYQPIYSDYFDDPGTGYRYEYTYGGETIYTPYYDDWGNYHSTPIAYEDSGAGRVVGADVDDPASALSYEIVGQPQWGGVSIDAAGNFQYTGWSAPNQPNDSYFQDSEVRTDAFQVKVTDPHGASTTQTVNVTHYGPYTAPGGSGGSGGGGGKPISVDMDGNGFNFTKVDDSNVFFDINGDGWKHRMAWVAPGDGLLAYDADGNGKIDHADEISFVGYKSGAQTDLEGLKAFDSNGDGLLSAADDKWSKFGIWQDANQDGVTDPGELKSLDELGVASISLTSDGQFSVIDGQTVHGVGTVTKTDGSTLNLADVTLEYSNDVLINNPDGTSQVVVKPPFSPSDEVLNGTDGNDLILGKTGNNIINAGAGDDVVMEDGGNDFIDGGDGNDTIYAGADADLVIAGAGDDVVFAGLGNDLVFGGDGHDALFGEGGNDVIFGGKGNDLVSGDSGNDVLSGDAGDDQVYGGSGNDAVFGGAGNDELAGMDGYDRLDGGTGNDLLDGGADADEMIGGSGDDIYVVDNVGDTVTENPDEGIDTVRSSISYALAADLENLTLTGTENLTGTGNDADNVLIGNSGDNTLTAGAGNDTLDGGMGADILVGGTGDDVYVVDNAGDIVFERTNEGTDSVLSSVSYALTDNVENLVLTGRSAIDATGNALDNVLTGNIADNVLDGGIGADTMAGGRGNDTYVVDNTGDRAIELANEGVDTVASSLSWMLADNIENLTLTGTADLSGTGNELGNVIVGNAGSNRIDGGLGADTMAGGAGDDTYIVDNTADVIIEAANGGDDSVFASASYTLSDNVENLTLTGTANIDGSGNALDNVIVGNSGNNVLDGGAGADALAGGAGNDTYVVDNPSTGSGQAQGDTVTELADEGIDTVQSSIDYALGANVENLTLTGMADLNGAGNELDNVIAGNDGNNLLLGAAGNDTLFGSGGNDTLDGGTGADAMSGGAGDDTYIVDNAGDLVVEQFNAGIDNVYSSISYVLPENVENLTLTGADAINGNGNALDNVIVGNVANNVIDGGAGADAMDGGTGDDIYIVDNAGDAVIENLNEGNDSVFASVSYALSDNVENLILTGANAIDGSGNGLDNLIVGNVANNVLDGGAGADAMAGGAGGDTYIVDNVNDTVTEQSGEDIDTVLSSVSYGLSANVENLTLAGTENLSGTGNSLDNVLIGNDGDNRLFGEAGNDMLIGNGGNDLLDGGTGADAMSGGAGDDTYIVDNVGDAVTELASEGIDTVYSSIDYTLGDNVEDITLAGTANLTGTGNELDNIILGNSGDNRIDGGSGADTMAGGAGDDAYIVDNAGDLVIEQFNAGIDHVYSSISYVLPQNVENLTLTGPSTSSGQAPAIDGTGNDLGNIIVGNAANNVLDGAAGADTLIGGAGDDTYIVDNAGDRTVELAGEGVDTVYSSVSWTLADHVENLTLAGSDAINGTGNTLDNIIIGNGTDNRLIGNAGNDSLFGNDGNDVLDGGTGNDILDGGSGDDAYLWRTGDGFDTIADTGGNDTVRFGDALNLNNLALRVTSENGIYTAHVRALDDCGCEMDDQGFDFAVGVDASGGYVSPIEQFRLADGTLLTFNDLLIKTVVTNVSPQTRTVITGRDDDIIYAGPTSDLIRSGTGNDIVYAFAAKDVVYGEGGNDALLGGTGADTLDGGCGYNILAGGIGQDVLRAGDLNNLFLGGAGSDQVFAGAGNDFIAGGRQDDTITTGAGSNIVAFNKQDGRDTILASAGARNSLSLGGGLSYGDLGFMRSGNDLVLDAGGSDAITFKDWYASLANRSFVTLQMIEEASADYAPAGTDVLRDNKVERFDFQKLADSFGQARAANPGLTRWNLMNGLLDAHLGGSDNAALGGEFAYEYGQSGSLAQVGISAAQTALKDPGFGGLQTLKPFQGLTAEIAIGR